MTIVDAMAAGVGGSGVAPWARQSPYAIAYEFGMSDAISPVSCIGRCGSTTGSTLDRGISTASRVKEWAGPESTWCQLPTPERITDLTHATRSPRAALPTDEWWTQRLPCLTVQAFRGSSQHDGERTTRWPPEPQTYGEQDSIWYGV